jgi:hypothetical protein
MRGARAHMWDEEGERVSDRRLVKAADMLR